MKRFSIMMLLAITAISFSCRTAKKAQSIQTAITRKDTAQKITVKETPTIDSAKIVKDIMSKVMLQKINFNTFSAKIKVDYQGPEDGYQFNAYVKMTKDSVINLKIATGLTGVLFEAQIYKDSVILLNVRKKIVQYRSISYLQEVTEIPVDLYTLQDLIVGNPIFLSNNLVSYKAGESQLLVLMVGNIFKHLITLDVNDYTILHSKLDDVNAERNRTCDITMSDYEASNGSRFATKRRITVAEKSKLDIKLDFKQYAFNEPLTYSFNVPKNYKKK